MVGVKFANFILIHLGSAIDVRLLVVDWLVRLAETRHVWRREAVTDGSSRWLRRPNLHDESSHDQRSSRASAENDLFWELESERSVRCGSFVCVVSFCTVT